jgi:hypothetical protein
MRRARPQTAKKTKKIKENRMKKRDFFDRNQAVKVLGDIVESLKLLESTGNAPHEHFTF